MRDVADLLAGWHAAHAASYRLVGSCTPRAHVIERDGLVASVVPERPERSIFNAVVYRNRDALVLAIPELARAYGEAGVNAWTVWVHPGDDAVAEALARERHRLDATPELMAARLAELDLAPHREVVVEPGTWEEVAAINGASYPVPEDTFAPLAGIGDGMERWVARRDGRALACACTVEAEGTVAVNFVAALAEARGAGLVTEVLRHALRTARDRGAVATTLEATAMGRPVYERVGYRALGVVQMWERRRPAGAAA